VGRLEDDYRAWVEDIRRAEAELKALVDTPLVRRAEAELKALDTPSARRALEEFCAVERAVRALVDSGPVPKREARPQSSPDPRDRTRAPSPAKDDAVTTLRRKGQQAAADVKRAATECIAQAIEANKRRKRAVTDTPMTDTAAANMYLAKHFTKPKGRTVLTWGDLSEQEQTTARNSLLSRLRRHRKKTPDVR
jgi:hypothetical protein